MRRRQGQGGLELAGLMCSSCRKALRLAAGTSREER